MIRKLIIAAAVMAIAAPAAAWPSNMEQYSARMKRAQSSVNLAMIATQCGLRSERWFEVFQDGYQLLATSEARRLGLGSSGLSVSDAMADSVARETRAGMTCSKLVNSPTMARLDKIHDTLTGGFR